MSQELSRHGIGGSEAAAVVGLSPYVTPIDLWVGKREELAGNATPRPPNAAMQWGIYLEAPIRQAYADRFGVEVVTPPRSLFHPQHDWRRATPDGLIMHGGSAIERGLEIKTASHRLAHTWGEDGTDDVPPHYAVQCLWSMHVLDVDEWDLATLIGGSDFRCYRLRRDRELEADLVAQVEEFWQRNILGGEEPEVDGSESFKNYLVRKWPGTGEPIEATPTMDLLIGDIWTKRAQVAKLSAELAQEENDLRAMLGDASEVESSLGKIICRPRLGRAITNWEAIARALADEAGLAGSCALDLLKAEHTKRARPSRPLLYPRAWSTTASADE